MPLERMAPPALAVWLPLSVHCVSASVPELVFKIAPASFVERQPVMVQRVRVRLPWLRMAPASPSPEPPPLARVKPRMATVRPAFTVNSR